MSLLRRYDSIVGKEIIRQIEEDAKNLKGKRILNINSTYQGGGVAEILSRLVPLMNELKIDAGWRILYGSRDFFIVTKKIYNSLQGEEINLAKSQKSLYLDTNEMFSKFTHIVHDAVIIHDNQPLPLIKFYKKKQPWIWRCHTDISNPNPTTFGYLKPFILKYDKMIVLSPKFRKDLPIQQVVMCPSIDPLSRKNIDLTKKTIERQFADVGVETDKPIICQVSRFDKWKDHKGVIKIFREVRKKIPCRLVLIGSMAQDDPEGQRIYELIMKETEHEKDIMVINHSNDTLVNALQRASAVIIQKSYREGFGLTISEALWKGTPIVASNVGGITQQIIDGKNGFLLDPSDYKGFVSRIILLLRNRRLREEMGEFGREYVRRNFLVTRHLHDWIKVLSDSLK